jgi:hypothetical protein
MKVLTNKTKTIFMILCLFTLLVAQIASAETFAGNRYGGVANIPYFYLNTVSSYGYDSLLNASIPTWNGITSQVGLSRTYTFTPLVTDLYSVATTSTGAGGETIYYRCPGGACSPVNPDFGQWDYAAVIIYDNNVFDLEYNQKVNVVIHEVGHTLSLTHHDSSPSVMNTNALYKLTAPNAYDQTTLMSRWP